MKALISLPALCLLIACLLFPGRAYALTVNSASCSAQAHNVLRYDCDVETNTAAQVENKFCDATVDGASCAKNRQSATLTGVFTTSCNVGGSCYKTHIRIWNLISGDDYEWLAHAHQGGSTADSATGYWTVASLPSDVGNLVNTISSTSYDLQYVMLNSSCGANRDYVVIVDEDGNVVWYEDVRYVTNGSATGNSSIKAISLAPSNHIQVIVDDDWVIEYTLAGDVVAALSRDAGDFEDADTVDRYVHHDIRRGPDGHNYVLTAREDTFTDSDNCDANGGTSSLDWVVDGVFEFSSDWTTLIDEWNLDEVIDPADCTAYCAGGTPCYGAAGYWNGKLSAADWAHANSIWVTGGDDWLISLNHLDRFIQVDGAAGTEDWELWGDESGGDWSVVASPTITPTTFSGRHNVWRTLAGTIMMFDNHTDDTPDSSTSRALELDLDPGSWEYDVIAEYDTGINCSATGSSWEVTANGDVVTGCLDGVIQEFDSGGSIVWEDDLSCSSGTLGFLYRAVPISL